MTKLNKEKTLSRNKKVDKEVVEGYKILRRDRGEPTVRSNSYRVGRPIEESGIQHYHAQR